MVIGYSFSDQHIREMVEEAWRSRALQGMFLVDPADRDILNPARHRNRSIWKHQDLEDIPSLGDSIRQISTTFGGDAFEHQKFIRFFQT
jgi:hypothetical protein